MFGVDAGNVTEVASFYAYDPAFSGGVNVAAADMTGDGVAEIITGAGPSAAPHVRVIEFKGGALTELASFYAYDAAFTGGVSVAGGDVDGDGIAEVITGAGAGAGPHVRVFAVDAGSVTERASFYAYDPAFSGGVRVASAATPRGEVAMAAAPASGGRAVTGHDVNGIAKDRRGLAVVNRQRSFIELALQRFDALVQHTTRVMLNRQFRVSVRENRVTVDTTGRRRSRFPSPALLRTFRQSSSGSSRNC